MLMRYELTGRLPVGAQTPPHQEVIFPVEIKTIRT